MNWWRNFCKNANKTWHYEKDVFIMFCVGFLMFLGLIAFGIYGLITAFVAYPLNTSIAVAIGISIIGGIVAIVRYGDKLNDV